MQKEGGEGKKGLAWERANPVRLSDVLTGSWSFSPSSLQKKGCDLEVSFHHRMTSGAVCQLVTVRWSHAESEANTAAVNVACPAVRRAKLVFQAN